MTTIPELTTTQRSSLGSLIPSHIVYGVQLFIVRLGIMKSYRDK